MIATFSAGSCEMCCADAQVRHDGKLQAERVAALQERKRALEALLHTRVEELKLVCFQEAVSTTLEPHAALQPTPPLAFHQKYSTMLLL